MLEKVFRERSKDPVYCQVCTFPVEFCLYGPNPTRCKEWLLESHSDLYKDLYVEETIAKDIAELSLEEQQKVEKDLKKKEAKQEARESREQKKKLASKVLIKRAERNKRKHVTIIAGLENFGITDLKPIAKTFGQKFATGASVTKNAAQQLEITIQGDHVDEAFALLQTQFPQIPKENYYDENNKRLM